MNKMLTLANISNGLVYPHDDVCYFQSQHGHHMKAGYFRIDAMSYNAVIHLLKGGSIKIIDGTSKHKRLTDAQKFGVPTWCLVFNRALDTNGSRKVVVCDWQTPEMKEVAMSDIHKPLVNSIRKLIRIFGWCKPLVIGDKVLLECHRVDFDDKPRRIRWRIDTSFTYERKGKGESKCPPPTIFPLAHYQQALIITAPASQSRRIDRLIS